MKLSDLLTAAQQASRSVGQGVTGLVDLSTLATNAMLRPFGKSVAVEQVPFSTPWAEGKGLLAPADYSPAGIAGQTIGGLLGPIGAAKAPQIAAGAIQAQKNLAAPGTLRRQSERGIFMGDLSKTWDKSAAAKAEAMEKAGADPRAIWQETGTFRGVDGKWRQEIDDSAATVSDRAVNYVHSMQAANPLHEATIGGVMKHPELAASGYGLERIPLTVSGSGGSYTPPLRDIESIRIGGVSSGSSPKSVALHELQHAIQQRQGFSKGGSSSEFAGVNAEAQRALDEINAILNSGAYNMKDYASLLQRKRDILNMAGGGLSPHEQYRRLAGEAEARAVQARMKMSPAERRAVFPLDSYDVPISELLVR